MKIHFTENEITEIIIFEKHLPNIAKKDLKLFENYLVEKQKYNLYICIMYYVYMYLCIYYVYIEKFQIFFHTFVYLKL